MIPHRGEFLNVELKAAVAIGTDRTFAPTGQTDAYAGRDTVSHRTQSGGVDESLPGSCRPCADEDLDADAGTAGENLVVRACDFRDHFREMENADCKNSSVFFLDERIALFPIAAARLPLTTI